MEKLNQRYFMLIISVCMVMPVSVDIFLSGLPAIQQIFPGNDVGLILSTTLFGLSLAQLLYGPLLDRYGRKPILILGLALFTIASLFVMTANSFSELILGRFLQAIGGCSCTVAVFAIVRDCCDKDEMLYFFGTIMALIGISPIISPLVGGYLNAIFGWRGSFVFLFFLGAFYFLVICFFYRETLDTKSRTNLSLKNIAIRYFDLICIRGFLAYCFVSGFTYCILFSYLNLSSIFIINGFNYDMILYGWIVASNAVPIIVMAKIAPLIARKTSLNMTLFIGYFFILTGGTLMFFLNIIHAPNIYSLMIPMYLATIGTGIIRPIASAGAMGLVQKPMAGTASAFYNFISFGCGAVVSYCAFIIIGDMAQFGLLICLFAVLSIALSILQFYHLEENASEKV